MPTLADITALATSWGVDPLSVAAFAGANRRLPANQNELTTFVAVLLPVAQADNLDLTLIEGYLQEGRASTSSIAGTSSTDIINWATSRGYLDQNGHLAFTPLAGQGYPSGTNLGTIPGGVPSTPNQPPAPSSSPINLTLPSVAGFQLKPIYVAGAVVALVGYAWLTGPRRR